MNFPCPYCDSLYRHEEREITTIDGTVCLKTICAIWKEHIYWRDVVLHKQTLELPWFREYSERWGYGLEAA